MKLIEKTAHHEAGHAACNLILGRAFEYVTIVQDEDSYGHCKGVIYRGPRLRLQDELAHEMLRKDPLRGVELPGRGKRAANVLDPEEAARVLDACKAEPGGIYAAFLLWAGCRPNEAAALQWRDVDKGLIFRRSRAIHAQARYFDGRKWLYSLIFRWHI